jgi:putative colanic acid biosynthesis glycosyltransferase
MKILQINNHYKYGSTGKLTYYLHNYFQKRGLNSYVIYGRGERYNEKNVYKSSFEIISKFNGFISKLTGFQYSRNFLSTFFVFIKILTIKPDIIHLQCINGNFINIYLILNFLKKSNIKTVLTLHAEFMYTGGCGHSLTCNKWLTGCGNCPQLSRATGSYFFDQTAKQWLLMKNAMDNFSNLQITSVSEWLANRAINAPILFGKSNLVIYNGIDTNVFKIKPNNSHIFSLFNLPLNKKVVLFVTPFFDISEGGIKGGSYLLEIAKEFLKDQSIIFLVVGKHIPLHNLSLSPNIFFTGEIKDSKLLSDLYNFANLTLLLSKRETFSLVTIESLCCGTPVVGFECGAPELIVSKDYSEFVIYGNKSLLIQSLLRWMNFKNTSSSTEISNYAKIKFGLETMGEKFIKIYEQLGGKKIV